MRRPRFFRLGQGEYPAFPGWNRTLCDARGMMIPLVALSEDEMAAMPEEARYVRGVPSHICLHPVKRTVDVYPVPDADYDAVIETKGWQVG